MSNQEYKITVGIECHVQLKTKTKLFSGALNLDAIDQPNTTVNHIDFGLPGALPVLNKEALNLAIRAAFALKSKPQKFSKFDRKHYFYPDLPMGYQISQFDLPIILGGEVKIRDDQQDLIIRITRAHLESDAGKNIHPNNKNYSLVDLNRAGTPLLEIVSEPDMHSAKQAKLYAQKLYLLMRYADVTNGNLYYGNMRFDVNVSLSKSEQLGVRAEIKNLNSFRSIEKAINYEYSRQSKLLDQGQKIIQETRGWDDNKEITYSLRSKENADDYRYMPDPDLPPIILDDKDILKIQNSMPTLPDEWIDIFKNYDLQSDLLFTLLENGLDNQQIHLKYLATSGSSSVRQIANLIVNHEIPLEVELKEKSKGISLSYPDRQKLYLKLVDLIKDNKLSSSSLKSVLVDLLQKDKLPDIDEYILENNFIQNSNQDELNEVVQRVLESNPKPLEDYINGQEKALQFIVGQVMKETKGQANPQIVKDIILNSIKDKK